MAAILLEAPGRTISFCSSPWRGTHSEAGVPVHLQGQRGGSSPLSASLFMSAVSGSDPQPLCSEESVMTLDPPKLSRSPLCQGSQSNSTCREPSAPRGMRCPSHRSWTRERSFGDHGSAHHLLLVPCRSHDPLTLTKLTPPQGQPQPLHLRQRTCPTSFLHHFPPQQNCCTIICIIFVHIFFIFRTEI